ncbi:MAG: porin family protein [Spirochaetia bacterium]|jgi:hypothetical protein|nr:porin family protein [Spirochaetia bacterium]
MKKSIKLTSCYCAAIFITIFLISCQTTQQNFIKPVFDDTHALLVEKCARELPIMDLIAGSINASEKVLVASFEKSGHDNSGINYLVEDNLIYNLVSNGHIALERNREMLNRIDDEQEKFYYSYSMSNFPHHPLFLLLKFLEDRGLDISSHEDVIRSLSQAENIDNVEYLKIVNDISSVDIKNFIDLYQIFKNDYTNIREETRNRISLVTADVIISYRVLEAGLFFEVENIQDGSVSNNQKWAHLYNRDAMIRLFVRITDAKTGEIRKAGIVEKRLSDTVEFKQIENESDTHYFERIKEYIRLLEEYNYQFYSQSLPHQNTIKTDNPAQEAITVLKPVIEEKKEQVEIPNVKNPKISAGVKAGTNIGWFSGKEWDDALTNTDGVNRARMGISAAAFLEAGLTDWVALQPEIGYTSRRGGAEYYDIDGNKVKETIKANVIDFTLFVKPRLPVGDGFLYGLIGPQFSLILGDIESEINVDGDSYSSEFISDNSLLFGIGLGGGYTHPLGAGRILFDFIYSHAFTSISDNADIFLNGSALKLGYTFMIK